MFLAVSNLSPVNIQTLIPAWWKEWIVSATLSCNQSSTQVAPIRVNPLSKLLKSSQ